MQLFGGSLPIIPSMAKEAIPKVWFCSGFFFNSVADWREAGYLSSRVRDRRTGTRPAWFRTATAARSPSAAVAVAAAR